MKKEMTGWKDGALMICTKCGTRAVAGEFNKTWTPEWAEQTKMAMKKEMKEKGLAKNLRVMTSSCLGLCPENEQTVLLLEKTPDGEKSQLLVFNPEDEPMALQEFARDWLRERGK